MKPKYFKFKDGRLKLPVFFPDATKGVVRTLDSNDLLNTKTPGVLVNTFHLFLDLDKNIIQSHKGIKNFMGWHQAVISDSGGFQVMSILKKGGYEKSISDQGIKVKLNKKQIIFTPEESIRYQMQLNTDMVVVLDDFTEPTASYTKAKKTVARTIYWAKRSKDEFENICKKKHLSREKRPYILGVVQGGDYLDLRKECTKALVNIGFDGLGYGGWPITDGNFNYKVARVIADNAPENYLLYGLGIGKPQEIVGCFNLGYTIFDCVLPTRDARHRRLYVYNANSIDKIDVRKPKFYSYFVPDKEKYAKDTKPISLACDCLLCKNYTRSYLFHLFKIKDTTSMRLATIHNLRFYSILMEKLQNES